MKYYDFASSIEPSPGPYKPVFYLERSFRYFSLLEENCTCWDWSLCIVCISITELYCSVIDMQTIQRDQFLCYRAQATCRLSHGHCWTHNALGKQCGTWSQLENVKASRMQSTAEIWLKSRSCPLSWEPLQGHGISQMKMEFFMITGLFLI